MESPQVREDLITASKAHEDHDLAGFEYTSSNWSSFCATISLFAIGKQTSKKQEEKKQEKERMIQEFSKGKERGGKSLQTKTMPKP